MSLLSKLIQNKTLPHLFNVVLVAVLGYVIAVWLWSLFAPQFDVNQDESFGAVSKEHSSSHSSQVRYGQKIANLHLFGIFTPPKVKKPTNTQSVAPVTRLNLKLKGVLAHSDPRFAYALVSESGVEKSYGVGEMLPGNAKLTEVYPDKVIIDYQGQSQTLLLEKRAELGSGVSVTQVSRRHKQTGAGGHRQKFTPVTRERAVEIRQQIMANPTSFLNTLAIEPHKNQSGQIDGYKMKPVGHNPIFQEVGLQQGDVLTSVNDISIMNTSQLQSLIGAPYYDVTVLRQGVPVTLHIDF